MIQRQQKTNRNHRSSRARAIVAATAAAAAAIGGVAPSTAQATIKINEVMLNAPGTNATQDFIELKSSTGGVEAFDLTMVMLEGDAGAAGGVGVIDHFVQLTGSTGVNGLYLRHSFGAATITPAPSSDTVIATGGYGHENQAITWLLVTGFDPLATPATTDLDTNDDGVLDLTPWTSVVNAIGSGDGDANGDRTYAAQFGGADFNANSTSMPAPADGKPEAIAFRDANRLMHLASIMSTPAPTVGGPYPVTNGGFTVQTGLVASPGNPNDAITTGARGWIGAAAGSFNTGSNWTTGAAPSAAGDIAVFDGAGANTISLTADATAGILSFNGGNQTIAAGGGTLTIATVSGNAQVLGQYGNATINAPVVLSAATTNLRPGRSATLTFGNLDAAGKNINKQAIGTLILNSNAPGQDINIGTLNISSGAITFSSDGSKNRVLVANSLVMSGTTSRIDLSDNKLITNTPVGTSNGVLYSDVSGMVQKGFNLGGWAGQGIAIRTSQPDALTGLTNIGVAPASKVLSIGATDTGMFAGVSVTGASTLVMYTYGGDANLDGVVSGDDYSAIDFAIVTPGAAGWSNGDFNWDGIISGDDYSVIDFNIVAQGATIPVNAPAVSGVSAVPEPASLGLAGIGAAALLGRRNRRRK